MIDKDRLNPYGKGMNFTGKTIAIGVTGGIAAYRSCDLVRELYRRKAGRVVALMTPSAMAFLPPLTLQALTGEAVHVSELAVDPQGIPWHIVMAQQADALLIHPATVNSMAKLAHGLADDIVTTTAITFTDKPLLLAPAMNTRMWENPLTQRNVQTLRALPNLTLIEPTAGLLACGETGEGHLAHAETVLQYLYRATHPDAGLYQDQKVLVTAGGTAEPIDPVRTLTNRSSGKMGVALADELFAMGADVTLIATTSVDVPDLIARPYDVVTVERSAEMALAVETRFEDSNLLVMAAAVSDFQAAAESSQKIKRGLANLSLELEPTTDILGSIAQRKRANQRVVGFAAESQDVLLNASEKLVRKHLDAIVVNDISRPDIGFQSDENEVSVLFPNRERVHIAKAAKDMVARQILQALHRNFQESAKNVSTIA